MVHRQVGIAMALFLCQSRYRNISLIFSPSTTNTLYRIIIEEEYYTQNETTSTISNHLFPGVSSAIEKKTILDLGLPLSSAPAPPTAPQVSLPNAHYSAFRRFVEWI